MNKERMKKKTIPRYLLSLISAVLTMCLAAASVTAVSADTSTTPAVEFTLSEQEIIKKSETEPIVIGVVDNYAPISYWDQENSSFDGVAVDLFSTICERIGLNIKYVKVNESRYQDASNPDENSPMLVVGIPIVDGVIDDRGWFFSDRLVEDQLRVASRVGTDLTAEADNKTFAIKESSKISQNYVEEYFPDFTIVEYNNITECMNAVARGEASATVLLQSCINYLLRKPEYSQIVNVPAKTTTAAMCVAGFTPESLEYIELINKGMSTISDKEINALMIDSIMLNPYKFTLGDTIIQYKIPLIIITILVLALIAFFIAVLLQSKKATKKLEKSYRLEKEARAAALQANAAKSNFLSRMSHQIRTPLNAVIGYNSIAVNELTIVKNDSERKNAEMRVMDCLSKSGVASRHLLNIINDILDMSAIEAGTIKLTEERFDFRNLVTSQTTMFYTKAKSKNIEYEVIPDNIIDEWLVGNPMRLAQILSNLQSNAVKFTPEGGKVTVKIKQTDVNDEYSQIQFDIADTGIGMTTEFMEQIWTPFEQGDTTISRKAGGTGLGLAITKSLVDLLGGTISVKSQVGVGSTFTLRIKLKRTEQPISSASYDFSGINALVVDDERGTCDYLDMLFARFGVRCTTALSGKEALDKINVAKENKEMFTLCLIDWRMPDMDGIETIQHIRDIVGDDMPIIVVTAYDFSEIASQAAEYGVNMFISKPLFQSSLFDLISNIAGQRTKKRPATKAPKISFNGARIILAEDNAMNMEIAKNILETAGLNVDYAWNGQEAVNLFSAAPEGTYKAILMDIQMPVMDGHSASKVIRRSSHPEAKTIPIIAMTADAFTENVAESKASGMNDHIAKPIDLQTLFDILGQYIK